MSDFPSQSRYDSMTYRRCGNSGIQLPLLSLGLWHNFGGVDVFENSRAMVRTAFDHGITHLDLANNYGPALWLCRRDPRPHPPTRPIALPGRTDYLHQGRI